MKRSTLLIVFVLCLFLCRRSYSGDLGSNLMQRMDVRGAAGSPANRVGLFVPPSNDGPAVYRNDTDNSDYSSLVVYQQNRISNLTDEQRERTSLVSIDENLQTDELSVHLLYNCFTLECYYEMTSFFIDSGKKSELGEPLLRYINHSDSLTYYVLSNRPTNDAQFDRRANGCLIKKTYSMYDAIRFFDRTSEIFLYRLADSNGLLLVRGSYVYVDENLNGIPEAIYMAQRYKTSDRKNFNYLLPVQRGEKTINGSSKAKLFTDSLDTIMDIIQTQYVAKQQ